MSYAFPFNRASICGPTAVMSLSATEMTYAKQLNALTSLRFIAAAMTVFHHSRDQFGFTYDAHWLGNGVSFFFVLSGFILTYVYPSLPDGKSVKRFLIARFARIWPAHVASLFILLALIPAQEWLPQLQNPLLVAAANLTMVHSWIPSREYYFSFNSPSWSISTEFLFYLLFPLFLFRWERSWPVKMLGAAFWLCALVIACNVAQVTPENLVRQRNYAEEWIYIHPLGRVFEFLLGMTTAVLWRSVRSAIALSVCRATVAESLAVLLTVFSLSVSGTLGQALSAYVGGAGATWIMSSGTAPCFALLILAMATERGLISQLLSHPVFVFLGEISFSIYLLHQILLRYYQGHSRAFSEMPGWVLYAVFWGITVMMAYMVWRLVELPGRRILTRYQIQTSRVRSDKMLSSRKVLLTAAVLLVGLMSMTYAIAHRPMAGIRVIDRKSAYELTAAPGWAARQVRFGDGFMLLAAKLTPNSEGVTIDLIWESMKTQMLTYSNAVHFLDSRIRL